MQVIVFLALLSLAAACGNSCSCGKSSCCQNNQYSGSPYSVFGFGIDQQYGFSQQYGNNQQFGFNQQFGYNQNYGYNQQYGSGQRFSSGISCLKVDAIPTSLYQLYQNQPVYSRVRVDNDESRQIDNVCTTLFPLPDDERTFVVYASYVFCDGSNTVVTSIAQDVGPGTVLSGNAYFSVTQRNFASFGNDLLIGCSRQEYGNPIASEVYAFSLGRATPIEANCLHQIQNIIECAGQGEGALYVLPYRLPTRCVTQQVCSLTNPLLFPNNPYGASNYGLNNGLNYDFGLGGTNLRQNHLCNDGQCAIR